MVLIKKEYPGGGDYGDQVDRGFHMDKSEIFHRLEHHAGNEDLNMGVASFVGMLRPYSGLSEDAYNDVMFLIRSLSSYLRDSIVVDKEMVASLCG